MSLNLTVNKKVLENIVHETFSHFGFLSSSSLLDSLKLLGFYYATNAGISINIEDLKTPDLKKRYIQTAKEEITNISQAWSEGLVSDQERFNSIIDSWNLATESLKNRIIEYYQNFDPANNLYIMAFSGARGNMSQVRQLVGMRGLMSDQEGKIIDLPIQANFREGLSSIDYIISSYGARKGIVDTALKTADSGYLTRRLIYLAQDLVIREIDCKTKKGILILLKKNNSTKNLIGKQLISVKKGEFPFSLISDFNITRKKDIILTDKILEKIKTYSPILLVIRSSLTCQSNGSICQKCYGWDLAQQKLISLGETVGILAAQSIGEPGTQLTMRTFHTGGIFTGETLKQIVAPFSGKIIIPNSLKTAFYRTNHGVEVLKLHQEALIKLVNWKGIETNIFLEIGSYLYISKTSFVYKGQLISEFLNQAIVSAQRKLKPIYTRISGKVICNNVIPSFRRTRKGKTRRILLKQGLLWIASGKVISLPIEANYVFDKILKKDKTIAKLKIISPKEGIILLNDFSFCLLHQQQRINFDFSEFNQNFTNCSLKIIPTIRNYQYVDKHTIIGFIYIFPNYEGEILLIEKKKFKWVNTFFISTKNDAWNFYGPLYLQDSKKNYIKKRKYSSLNFLNIKNIKQKKFNDFKGFQIANKQLLLKKIITPTTFKNPLLNIKNCGLNIFRDKYFNTFQHLEPICVPTSTILNYIQNDLVEEKKLFATLVNYSQQTDDIVQGLPKIEELIEARKPKIEACLAKRPGILLNNFSSKAVFSLTYYQISKKKNILKYIIPKFYLKKKSRNSKEDDINEKQILILGHSFIFKNNILIYDNNFFEVNYFSSFFQFNETDFCFKNIKDGTKLELAGKKYKWKKKIMPNKLFEIILNFINKKRKNIFNSLSYQKENYIIYETTNELGEKDYIFQINEKISLYLKYLVMPLTKYSLNGNSKIIIQQGQFVDIGEPITDGVIDSHELLNILFSYHIEFDGIIEGTIKSLNKFQLILVNSIQSIYQAQGVNISSKHIEIIVRQMTSKVVIKNSGDSPFLPGELISISLILEIYEALILNPSYKTPIFDPKLLSATNSSLNKDGFLSAAGFQETRKILTKAAIEGTSDWLRGLKESIMSGRMIPAGSAFLNYKNYLDNLYSFKN
jgi:hypothetical protein